MRPSLHLLFAIVVLGLALGALTQGCGDDDLAVGGSVPIITAGTRGPTLTPTCVPRNGTCDPQLDNCCNALICSNLTLTCIQ